MVEVKYDDQEYNLREYVKRLIKCTLIGIFIGSMCAVLTCWFFAA